MWNSCRPGLKYIGYGLVFLLIGATVLVGLDSLSGPSHSVRIVTALVSYLTPIFWLGCWLKAFYKTMTQEHWVFEEAADWAAKRAWLPGVATGILLYLLPADLVHRLDKHSRVRKYRLLRHSLLKKAYYKQECIYSISGDYAAFKEYFKTVVMSSEERRYSGGEAHPGAKILELVEGRLQPTLEDLLPALSSPNRCLRLSALRLIPPPDT